MKRKGITLVEVLVVTAIVVSLVAVGWMLLAQAAKRRALEVGVRNDLRQFVVALTMYKSDYDGVYPLGADALHRHVPNVPLEPTNIREPLPGCGAGSVEYHFTRNISILTLEKKYHAEYPFDERVNPVVKTPGICRKPGTTQEFVFYGAGHWQPRVREVKLVLGAKIDGSVGWFDSLEQWEEEFAGKAHR
jgi:hypothetical protein